METWVVVLIVLLVFFVLLPTIGAIFLIFGVTKNIKETGFCYTESDKESGCVLQSKSDCDNVSGKHFDTMNDCQQYWEDRKKNKKENYNESCC